LLLLLLLLLLRPPSSSKKWGPKRSCAIHENPADFGCLPDLLLLPKMRTHFGNEAREEEFSACCFVLCAAASSVRLTELRRFVAVVVGRVFWTFFSGGFL
jgi:hypothetical protein